MNKRNKKKIIVIFSSLIAVFLILFISNQMLSSEWNSSDEDLKTVTKNVVEDFDVQAMHVFEDTIWLDFHDGANVIEVVDYLEESLSQEELEKYEVKKTSH